MDAPKEERASLGHLTIMDRKTFTNPRDHCLTNSKVRELQQRWQELKERELRAHQQNKELLQQFDKAQDTVKEMLSCTAAMKTIRMEYERYLKESSPHWQQQLKEKTQAAQRMRMEHNLRSCLEAEVTKAYGDPHSEGSRHVAETHNIHPDNNQNSSTYPSYVQASWLTHPQSQTAGFPMRVSHHRQSSSHVPASFLPHPHPSTLHQLSPTPSHNPWPRQNVPGWCPLQPDCPWSWTAGAAGLPEPLWGQLHNKEPPSELLVSQAVAQEPETSGASSLMSERCGGRGTSRLSQELDVKPVRLSSGHAESSESGRDSSQAIGGRRRKERGRSQCESSEKESRSSEKSSRTSIADIIPSAAVAPSSESDASSGKCNTRASKKRRRRSGAQVAEALQIEKVLKEKHRNKGDESASQLVSGESGRQTEESTSGEAGHLSADDKSEVCREESGKSKPGNENQRQEIISSEQSSAEEKEEGDKHEKDLEGETEKENSPDDDDANGDEEGTDESGKKDECLEEEKSQQNEDTGEEEEEEIEEQESEIKDDDKGSSASSQDEEDESEQEAKTEEDEEGSADEKNVESDEEQRSDKEREPEEESDSEDSVISPKENGEHVTPEEAAEVDDKEKANKTGFSYDNNSNDSSEEDEIENLLTPQEQRQKREDKDLKVAEKPKVSDMMQIVQVEDGSTKITPQHSDSDEFDHFYD